VHEHVPDLVVVDIRMPPTQTWEARLRLETRAELVMFALANGVIGPSAA